MEIPFATIRAIRVNASVNHHERDLDLESDGAPYVQMGFGLKF
jgi:hypothetical protein